MFLFWVAIAVWVGHHIYKEYRNDREQKRMAERESKREIERLRRMVRNQESFEDVLLKIKRFDEYIKEGKSTTDIPEEDTHDFITYIVYKGEIKRQA